MRLYKGCLGRGKCAHSVFFCTFLIHLSSGELGAKAAEELSKATGRTCLSVQGDVRKPQDMKDAAKKCVEKFGKIDFVICGAAGNL